MVLDWFLLSLVVMVTSRSEVPEAVCCPALPPSPPDLGGPDWEGVVPAAGVLLSTRERKHMDISYQDISGF